MLGNAGRKQILPQWGWSCEASCRSTTRSLESRFWTAAPIRPSSSAHMMGICEYAGLAWSEIANLHLVVLVTVRHRQTVVVPILFCHAMLPRAWYTAQAQRWQTRRVQHLFHRIASPSLFSCLVGIFGGACWPVARRKIFHVAWQLQTSG